MEIVGIRGAPQATLDSVQMALANAEFASAIVTLVTDWQDQRNRQRYAVFVRWPGGAVLSEDAFGAAFGPAGYYALAQLVEWLRARGVSRFYEAVIPPSHYQTLFDQDPEQIYTTLVAAGNPADPDLYHPAH